MTKTEEYFLDELQAKFGDDAKLPTHNETCGIYWHHTCIDCLKLWQSTEREREIPPTVRQYLWYTAKYQSASK